jgi:micrococcal nuclease
MYTYKGNINRIVDGDTIDVLIDLGFHIASLIRVRLARIDAPETSTAEGKFLKTLLLEKIPIGTECTISTSKGDRYGRWIGEITVKGDNLSDWLLTQNLAKEYKK